MASYTSKILELAGMGGCNACQTPMENRLKLSKENAGDVVDATVYRSVISSLRYLVNTRPNIAHTVCITSRFMESPPDNAGALRNRYCGTYRVLLVLAVAIAETLHILFLLDTATVITQEIQMIRRAQVERHSS